MGPISKLDETQPKQFNFVASESNVKYYETRSTRGLRVRAFSEGVVAYFQWWIKNLHRNQ